MNNNEIELAKKIYDKIQLEKSEYEQTRQRLLELEQRPVIKKYLNLVNEVKEKKENMASDEYESVGRVFQGIADRTAESNNILIYKGAYEINCFDGAKLTETRFADYIMYQDLETLECYRINPREQKEFEKGKNIIHLNDKSFKCYSDYRNAFFKLRNEFLKELLVKPQEEVVRQLVKGKTK